MIVGAFGMTADAEFETTFLITWTARRHRYHDGLPATAAAHNAARRREWRAAEDDAAAQAARHRLRRLDDLHTTGELLEYIQKDVAFVS